MFEDQHIIVTRSYKSYADGERRSHKVLAYFMLGCMNVFGAFYIPFQLNILNEISMIIFFVFICVGEYVGYILVKRGLEKLRAKLDYAKRYGTKKSYSKRSNKKENYGKR